MSDTYNQVVICLERDEQQVQDSKSLKCCVLIRIYGLPGWPNADQYSTLLVVSHFCILSQFYMNMDINTDMKLNMTTCALYTVGSQSYIISFYGGCCQGLYFVMFLEVVP